MLTLPAALALAMLAVPLLSTLFQYGAFSADDVLQHARARWSPIRIGLTGLILVKVLAPGFYARQDIRTPVKIAMLHAAADATDEPRLHRLAPACRTGAVDRPGLLRQRLSALARPAPQRGATCRKRAGAAFPLRLLARPAGTRRRAVVRCGNRCHPGWP
jgi:putative peptidoglycan lipid II flippase